MLPQSLGLWEHPLLYTLHPCWSSARAVSFGPSSCYPQYSLGWFVVSCEWGSMCTLLPFPCRISCRLMFNAIVVCTVARKYSEVNFPLSSVLPRPDQSETDSTGNCCWFFPFKLANHLCVTNLFLVSLYQSILLWN